MRKGFTLLELMIVIIIIGILSTLGFGQYSRMVEKSRGAEARINLDALAALANDVYYTAVNPATLIIADFSNARLNLGMIAGQLPNACPGQATHYFSYSVTAYAAPSLTLTATRCIGVDGKQPGSTVASTLVMKVNFVTGTRVFTPQSIY